MTQPRDSYHQLIDRLDVLHEGITAALGDALTCSAGCSSCCLPISVFPVEAAAIIEAVLELPAAEQAAIRQALENQHNPERCALLQNDRCLIYPLRPVICRTHGLPLLVQEPEGDPTITVCPLNCVSMQSFAKETILDLERINQLLVAINLLFVTTTTQSWPERVALSDLGAYLCKPSP